MHSSMMSDSLTITSLMKNAQKMYPNTEVVSYTHENPRHRTTLGQVFDRSAKLANALEKLGAQAEDVVGTLAWNDYRHVEIYYAAVCSGLICHTVNPRLFPDQLVYILNHAEDKFLLVDPMFLPLIESISSQLKHLKGVIVLCTDKGMPDTKLTNTLCYETLLDNENSQREWPELQETDGCALCYTSGTTGNPKGVLYNHKAIVMQSFAACMVENMHVSNSDVVMPIVPMFHVNAWNLPYSAALVGFKLVMPGSKMGDPETLQALIEEEKVNFSAGVPTVWLGLLTYLRETGKQVTSLDRLVVGGSACPLSVMKEFEEKHNVFVHSGWGMTETAPLGSYFRLARPREAYTEQEFDRIWSSAGRKVFGIDFKIVNDKDQELPWDGVSVGALKVRGPWVVERYFKSTESATDANGWFDTGDVANIDAEGYLFITDRTKDVIKSGGEWISSIEIENISVGHPSVSEAAVIGVVHPKWDERPLLIIIKAPGQEITEQEMLEYLTGKIAKWWLPNAVIFVNEIPHTATGKIYKLELREKYAEYYLNN